MMSKTRRELETDSVPIISEIVYALSSKYLLSPTGVLPSQRHNMVIYYDKLIFQLDRLSGEANR